MIRISATLRIDIGGGVTDIPEISKEVGTCVTNIGLNLFSDENYSKIRQLKLSITKKDSSGINVVYKDYAHSSQEEYDDIPFVQQALKSFTKGYPLKKGYRMTVEDTLPKRTGLGGSSGLSIALNIIVQKIIANEKGEFYSPDANEILRRSHFFETEELGIKGGFQDFIGSFFGNVNLIDFPTLQNVNLSTYPKLGVPMESEMKEYLNKNMLIVLLRNDNIPSNIVVENEIQNYKADPLLMKPILRQIKYYNILIFNLLTQKGNINKRLSMLANAINKSWMLQKQLSPLVGKGKLLEIENKLIKYTNGLRWAGAGVNSLFVIMKPATKSRILNVLKAYSNDVEILFAQVNELGIRIENLLPSHDSLYKVARDELMQ